MQFEVGDLVRAHRAMGKGVDGIIETGDIGLVEELYHKSLPSTSSGQLYRIKWLPTTATGVWWMREEHVSPLDGANNAA